MSEEMRNDIVSDDELETVSGGKRRIGTRTIRSKKMTVSCMGCKKHFVADITSTHVKCPHCATVNRFDG